MQLTFTPTSATREYRIMHSGDTFAFTKAGVFAVPDDLGATLLAKHPELFGIHDPGGNGNGNENEKAVTQPTSNRMFGKPKRNK